MVSLFVIVDKQQARRYVRQARSSARPSPTVGSSPAATNVAVCPNAKSDHFGGGLCNSGDVVHERDGQ